MKKEQLHIFLIGMMGSGKSSVGRELARILHARFIDLDEEIEKLSGMHISEIFEKEGEGSFRDLETKTAMEMDLPERSVVACGGGFPLRNINMDWMQSMGTVIWLQADSSVILERIRHEERPLLPKPINENKIRSILSARIPVYKKAGIHINTNYYDPLTLALSIEEALNT